MLIKKKVFVLKAIKYSEADLILTGLASTGEKIGFIAKGARKSKKRFFGGILEPTHYIEVVYNQKAQRDEGQLHYITEAFLKNDFIKIRKDYDRLELAIYLLKAIEKISVEGIDEAKSNFNLLGNTLTALEESENLGLLKTHFELKLLYFQGILPPEMNLKSLILRPIAQHKDIVKYIPENLQNFQIKVNQLVQNYVN